MPTLIAPPPVASEVVPAKKIAFILSKASYSSKSVYYSFKE